jgi:hypothetical protein
MNALIRVVQIPKNPVLVSAIATVKVRNALLEL